MQVVVVADKDGGLSFEALSVGDIIVGSVVKEGASSCSIVLG